MPDRFAIGSPRQRRARVARVAGSAVFAIGLGLAVASASARYRAPYEQQARPSTPQKAAAVSMVVYKSATCGCCSAWIEYIRGQGFEVETHNVSDAQLSTIAMQSGVPDDLQSCHTAKVGGYIVEGHVPAEDIRRMLKEKPAILGIAVAGMPMGSPGMEQGGANQPFTTMAFAKDGKRTVFARH